MAIDYVMPKLAMAMNEGTINEWLVGEGDYVERGQPLATIETEKVAYDVEAPESGYLHILLPGGESADCESLIARFAQSEEELAQLQAAADTGQVATEPVAAAAVTPTPSSSPSGNGQDRAAGERIKASPLARKIAADAGQPLVSLTGSGPGGRIIKRDVLAAIERAAQGHAPATLAAQRILARVPMTGMRQAIAERMSQSLQQAAQLSCNWESDITRLLEMRQSFIAREEQLGARPSFNAFLARAIVYAVRRVPVANACIEGDEVVIYDNVNLGIAVSLPGTTAYDSGLRVAVLRNVESMGVLQVDTAMKALVARVRDGEARAEDFTASTITLSSTAGIAPPGMTSTPVLNQPNVALLGPSTPVERPVVYEGEMAVRTMLPLSFTFDHRALDGEPAARFMKALHECLENPELMLA